MDIKLKKIIVRETIIATCIFVAVLVNYLIPYEKPVYSYLGIIDGHSYKVSFPIPLYAYPSSDPYKDNSPDKQIAKIFKAVVESYPESFNNKSYKDIIELQGYPEGFKIDQINYTNTPKGELRNTLSALVGLIVLAYAIYLLIHLVMAIRAYGIKKALVKTKNLLKKAVEKEFLIKAVLVLGILFILISILKSCGIYKTPKQEVEDDYYRRRRR